LDWTAYYTRSLAVDGVIPAVDGVVSAVDGVVPAVDGLVPAVDLEVGVVPAVVDLIRVLLAVAVDMVWAADMVVTVLQAMGLMEAQVTVVNTRIMMDKELGSEVITLLGMGPLSLMEEGTHQ
jgi:hypothetical protein